LSPEQITGASPTIESDIYSLGVVMYELLTGRPPFIANDVNQLLAMHRDINPNDPMNLNPEIPEELSQITLRALSKDLRRRFRSATQFRSAIFSIRQSLTLRTISQSMAVTNPKASTVSQPMEQSEKPLIYRDALNAEQSLKTQKPMGFDWVTILIAFLATLAVAGLVPFWIYIYFNIPGK
jgi:serine/threonine-protein kinase